MEVVSSHKGIYNVNDCMPGYGGTFCQKCKAGTYNPDYTKEECMPCPCTLSSSSEEPVTGSDSADYCNCAVDDSNTVSLLEVFVIAIAFNIVVFVTFYLFSKNASVKDDKSEK